jgi:hypothetical protein
VDQFGRGVFGDVLGTAPISTVDEKRDQQVKLWGEFQVGDEIDDDESRSKRQRLDEEEEEEEEEEVRPAASQTAPAVVHPLPVRVEQPQNLVPEEVVDLRKKPAQAHRMLEKTAATTASSELFAASHKYALNSDKGVAVAIAPEDINDEGLGKAELTRLYEDERMRSKPALGVAPGAGHVDISQMEQQPLAKKAAAAKDKDKKDKKKSKDFKF